MRQSPPQYRPSVHHLPPIPPPIFKSQIGFFLVIYDSFLRQFPKSEYRRFFGSPEIGGIARDDCIKCIDTNFNYRTIM